MIFGAPPLAPLLFPNLVLLAFIGLLRAAALSARNDRRSLHCAVERSENRVAPIVFQLLFFWELAELTAPVGSTFPFELLPRFVQRGRRALILGRRKKLDRIFDRCFGSDLIDAAEFADFF